MRGGIRTAARRVEARVTVQAPASEIVRRVPSDVAVEPLDDGRCIVQYYDADRDRAKKEVAIDEPPKPRALGDLYVG